MYLHVNSVYYASYSFLRHKGISTKIKCIFFQDLEITSSKIKLALMTFESQNDCIQTTPTLPFSPDLAKRIVTWD